MADMAAVTRLIEPAAKAEGLALVRVKMIGGTSDPTLQVMAERPETRQLSLQDCERLSRRLSDLLDENDPIEGAYRLEVSSPGIDRPLTRLSDFDDWKGHEARINLSNVLNGRKQIKGTLDGVEPKGDVVSVVTPDGVRHSIPFDTIASAKLVITDKLIQATAPISSEGADSIQVEG